MQTKDQYQIELLVLDNNTRNYLKVCERRISGSFKDNVSYKLFAYNIYIIIYKIIYKIGKKKSKTSTKKKKKERKKERKLVRKKKR